jgi:hypothetical protein
LFGRNIRGEYQARTVGCANSFLRIVATEMAKVAFEDLKLKGIDIAPLAVSVEQSCNDILQIVIITSWVAHGH